MRLFLQGLAALCVAALCSAEAWGAGQLVSTGGSTQDKPQSKLWYHDGSWWAVVKGPNGVAIHEKVSGNWQPGAFVDALLTSAGNADVKWNGSELTVLVYTLSPRLYQYTYDAELRTWNLQSGFPIAMPAPPGTETMVLEQDSSGRYWMVTESGGQILAYYTDQDARDWQPTPVVLQTSVDADDICSIVDLGDGRVGVFWSDQARDEFAFRLHHDNDDPTVWQPEELVLEGVGIADDHINLAVDSQHRVYAITKDDSDRMRLHRRSTLGVWETYLDVSAEDGTRGIIMLSEDDGLAYILYTAWEDAPNTIKLRVGDLETLQFDGTTRLLTSTVDMNDVTGTKQMLPAGVFEAMASSDAGQLWANGWGEPMVGGGAVPAVPMALQASIQPPPIGIDLQWTAPASGTPAQYNIQRQTGWGNFTQVGSVSGLVTSWTDPAPPEAVLTYRITAFDGRESSPSAAYSIDYSPVDPPGPVAQPDVLQVAGGSVTGELVLWFDEGSGTSTEDLSGNGNAPRFGNSDLLDFQDPTWVTGVSGQALHFDGLDDYLYVSHDPSLQMSSSFTIESWIQRHTAANGTLVNKGTSGDRNYRIRLTTAGRVEFHWEDANGISQELQSPAVLLEDTWMHIACVYDEAAQENRIYVDGALVATGAASGTPASNNTQLHIGTRLSGTLTEFLGASIDQLRIASGVLYSADFTPTTDPGQTSAAAETDVLVRWTAPLSGGPAVRYDVHRSIDGGATTLLGSVNGTSFVDTQLVEGDLCYFVEARNAQQEGSGLSSSACTTVLPPPPSAPTQLTALWQSGDPETYLFTWQAPTQNEPAVAYHVYRSRDGAAAQRLTSAPVSGLQWTDSTLVAGELCWTVRGVDAHGREGDATLATCETWTPPAGPPPTEPLALALTLGPAAGPGFAAGVAAFEMQEGSGQMTADQTINGLHAQLGTSPEIDAADPSWSTGIQGPGLQFDGINDRLIVSPDPALDFTGSFTVEAWVQRLASGERHMIVSKGDINQRNYWLQLTKSGYIEFGWETQSGKNHGTMTQSPITDNEWHHIAGVYDQEAGYSRIFLDGVLVRSKSDSGTPVTNLEPVLIGARLAGGSIEYFLEGRLDLVRLSQGVVYDDTFTPPQRYAVDDTVEAALLSWQAPLQGDVVGYNVYRSIDAGTPEKQNAQLLTEPAFADIHMATGNLCYTVHAVDAATQEGAASTAACVLYDATPPPPPPGAPQNLVAQWQAGPPAEAQLSWEPPVLATHVTYNIEHAIDAGPFARVNALPLPAASWNQGDLIPGDHCWRVTAIDSLGQEGSASTSACLQVLPPPPPAPAAPMLAMSSSGDSVQVTWTAIDTAQVSLWSVQRQANGAAWTELTQTAALEHVDANLLPGTLCYRIQAADSLGQWGALSDTSCIEVQIALPDPLAPPTTVTVTLQQEPQPGSATGVAAYPLDESDGQELLDFSSASGQGWLGETSGADESDPTRAPGFDGSALFFDGLDDHARLADAAALDLAGSFTVEVWAQRLASGDRMALLSKGNTNNRNFWLQFTKSGYIEFRWEVAGGANRGLMTSSRIADQEWHHIAGVYDQAAGKSRVFVDGVLWKEVDDSGTPVTNDDVVLIGARRTSGELEYFHNGGIDLVRISGTALYDSDFTPDTSMGSMREVASVTWSAIADAAGYVVERSHESGAYTALTTQPTPATSLVDVESPAGALCYRVATVDAFGQTGNFATPTCTVVSSDPGALPTPPTALTATLAHAEADSVQVDWTATGPYSHRLYRSVDAGSFTLLATLDPGITMHLDADVPLGNICYQMAAVDTLGREGSASDAVCVDVLGPLPDLLPPPQSVTAMWTEISDGGSGTATYAFNEGSGQSTQDVSSGLHAQLGADAIPDAADPVWGAGSEGNALFFDGSDDHLVVADDDALDIAGSFTIEAWVQRASSGERHGILGKGDTNTSNYWLRYTKSGYIEFRWEDASGSNHGTKSTFPVTDNGWHHIAAVYDQAAGESRLYLDGVEIRVSNDSGTPVTNDDPLIIGARYSVGVMTNQFHGGIDAVRISDSVQYDADFVPPTSYGGGGTVSVIDIAWQPPSTGSVASYQVWRQDAQGQWQTLGEPLTTLTARDAEPIGDTCYRVVALDMYGREGEASDAACTAAPTKGAALAVVPYRGPEFESMPNPFNPMTTVSFRLPDSRHVRIEIFDVRGRRVRQLLHEQRAAGEHRVVWRGRSDRGVSLASGTYFALLRAGDIHERLKLVILK